MNNLIARICITSALFAACSSPSAPPLFTPKSSLTATATPEPPAPRSSKPPAEIPWRAGYLPPVNTIRMSTTYLYGLKDGVLEWRKGSFVAHRWSAKGNLVQSTTPVSTPPAHGFNLNGILLSGDDRAARAIDIRSGRVRWKTPMPLRLTTFIKPAVAGSVLVADFNNVVSVPTRHMLVAFDRVTGRIVWQLAHDGRPIFRLVGTPQQLLIARSNGAVSSLNPTDGSGSWSNAEIPDSGDLVEMAVAGDQLLVASPRKAIRLLDIATGKERRRWPITTDVEAVRVAGNMGFLLRRDVKTDQLSVLAIELDSGEWKWQTNVAAFDWRRTILVVGAKAIYGCGGYGRLFAIDRVDGTPLWRYDNTHCGSFDPVVLPAVAARQETLLVHVGGPNVQLFESGGMPLQPPETVTVEGNVTLEHQGRCRLGINLSGVKGETDDQGNYRIESQGLGTLTVRVSAPYNCAFNHACRPVTLPLDGRNHYRANFWCKYVRHP